MCSHEHGRPLLLSDGRMGHDSGRATLKSLWEAARDGGRTVRKGRDQMSLCLACVCVCGRWSVIKGS